MNQDPVQAQLDARRKPGAVLKRLGGVQGGLAALLGRGVPREVRSVIAEAYKGTVYQRWSVVSERRSQIGEAFKDHTASDWSRVVETLVPQVAPSAKAALQALSRRPYQDGLTRKPFRCPRSPLTIADLRGRWLLNVTLLVGEYDADITWVAEHSAHLAGWSGSADLGWLLAGAMDAGGTKGDAVFDVLRATVLGDHEHAQMGRHVTQALTSCARPDAWELAEKLLLSAQRQEGLRQAILESVDESHPGAFRRMLRIIREENLTRFTSVVRAADTWFGFMWDGASTVKIDEVIDRVLLFLDSPDQRTAALAESDAEVVYLALWSTAFEDVDAAMQPAIALLSSPSREVRFVATHFLAQSLWTLAMPPLVDMLGDPELQIAARALDTFAQDATSLVDGVRLFDRLEELLKRMPARSQTLEPLVWPWWKRKFERPTVAAALAANAGKVKGERLLPYVPDLQPFDREQFVRRTAGLSNRWTPPAERSKPRRISEVERAVVLELLGDASADVRRAAFEAMHTQPLREDEVDRLIDLLARKPGDLRNGCLTRLRALPDDRLLAAAERLLSDETEGRRLAGLELLRDAVEKGRATAQARSRVEHYAAEHASLGDEERAHVTAVLGEQHAVASTSDSLGLVDTTALRQWPAPRSLPVDVDTPAARASLSALAELVLEHQMTEIRTADGETKHLVESAGWGFGPRKRDGEDAAQPAIPLEDVWKRWALHRDDAQRDGDRFELLRALVADPEDATWQSPAVKKVTALGAYGAGGRFLRGIVEWCLVWDSPREAFTFLLDGFEASLSKLSASDLHQIVQAVRDQSLARFYFGGQKVPAYRKKADRAEQWLRTARWWRSLFPGSVRPEDAVRLFGLLRWLDATTEGSGIIGVSVEEVADAWRGGAVSEAELTDMLVGRHSGQASLLRDMSAMKPPRTLAELPAVLAVVDRCRRRIVEVETQRGDRATAASPLAVALRWTGGLETVSLALPALGKAHFSRSIGWGTGDSRQDTLSHLVLRSVPRTEDTPDAFARWARAAKIGDARLVELAVYAPQWAGHVNHVLEWPGLESAVWWIQAHTKDDRSWSLQELKEIWAAQVSERTPLSAGDLTEGAVDVAWFREAYEALGAARWKVLDTAAKYAASSGGHTRAQLFARAMAGTVNRHELLERIDGSRHQDSVRALGLLPLAEGDARQPDLLERYERLQRFRREARKFGSQRQASETRAVAIGLDNLARTAGYRDPQRLQWALERQAAGELARGPRVLEKDDVRLQLAIGADGVPELTVAKKGKALKSVPASLKKDPDVAELTDSLRQLRAQRSRVREALEEAMCRGDRFGSAELRALLEHPVLAPALRGLVFVGDGLAGYLDEGGRVLRDHAGAMLPIGNDEEVRVAHAHDLFERGDWSAWQHECFRAERIQPFKQVFRELYPITESERSAERSRRYAGHQVNPRQALALLGKRGWVARPEEGVSRTFHEQGVTARLAFQETFYTPAEIEGLTLDEVLFTHKGEWKEIALREIPPRLFSETMRDLDLVVSVAHRGGVDPEATASTVEMRASLVQETCALLGLTNVELQKSHAIIRGELGTYSVHLGSAGAAILPGTALPIVAVHSQHRGRLFLPFADDDPRTAEVLSKVLLLARDRQIRDPNILDWIRAAQRGVVA